MRSLVLNVVRSQSLRSDEVVEVLNKFEVRYAKANADYEKTSAATDSFDLRVVELPLFDAFSRCANSTLIARTTNVLNAQLFSEFTSETHSASLNHAWITHYACYSNEAIESNIQDVRILAGLRREGYFAGIDVYGPSPATEDELRRAALLQMAISGMGISDQVSVFMDGNTLRMKARDPWKLVYPSARTDGGNPSGFYACGFSGIESALTAGQRLVEEYGKKRLGVGFSVRLPGSAYNQLHSILNEWHGWEMMLIGCPLSQIALSVLQGEAITEMSPHFIPAFSWWEKSMEATICGSLLVQDGRRFLELVADGGTKEMLQERVAFLKDIQFTPVFP